MVQTTSLIHDNLELQPLAVLKADLCQAAVLNSAIFEMIFFSVGFMCAPAASRLE